MKNRNYTLRRARTLFFLVFLLISFARGYAQEAYAELSTDNTTLTFYYDNQRSTRPGTTYDLNTGYSNPGWYDNRTSVTSVVFDSSFADARPTSTFSWFNGMSNLTTITDIGNLNTSEVTRMNNMFKGCSGLTNLNLSSFNTQNVTNMSYMFSGCSGLTSLNLSSFNTAKVTNMSYMFYYCSGLTSLNLSGFNTAKVTDMTSMFAQCSTLTSLDLSCFNTQEVTTMQYMFERCRNLQSLDVSSFYTPKVTNMFYLFSGCESLTRLDLRNFDPSSVTNMAGMFQGCAHLVTIFVSDKWSLSSPYPTSNYMFSGCTRIIGGMGTTYNAAYIMYPYAQIDGGPDSPGYFTDYDAYMNFPYAELSRDDQTLTFYNDGQQLSREGAVYSIRDDFSPSWTALKEGITTVVFDPSFSSVHPTGFTSWFTEMTSLTSITGFENLNMSNVTNISKMFKGCTSLTNINLTGFDTSNVTNMSDMFRECSSLTDIDFSGFNTSNVTDMSEMFWDCSSLTDIDFSGFNTSNVTNMSYMFSGCSSLVNLDVSNFNTQIVTNMSDMFNGCKSLKFLDLSSFNTANVTNMTRMFCVCDSLQTIVVGEGWSTAAVTSSTNMFFPCQKLVGGQGTKYNGTNDVTYAFVDGGTDNPGYLTDYETWYNGPYAVFDPANTTLTFYHDGQHCTRSLPTYLLYSRTYEPSWTAIAPNVTTVVFDESFTNARPKSTYHWFRMMSNLTNIVGLSNLITSEVTHMDAMFQLCSNLTTLDLSHFNLQKVESIRYMFDNCTGLTSVNLRCLSTLSNEINLSLNGLFWKCSSLTSLDLSDANTAGVTDMSYMFYACSSLTTLDLTSFNTTNVTDMSYMFQLCTNLTSLDLSNFNTQNVTNMSTMFANCLHLETINVSSAWSTKAVTESNYMFTGCTNLVGGMGTTYDANHVDKEYARIDNLPSSPGYFSYPNGPYAALIEDGKTLQFRNDGQRNNMPNIQTYSLNTGGSRPGWVVDGSNASITSVVFLDSFASARPTTMLSWFEGMTNLTRVWNPEYLNTSEVTDMAKLFKDCSKLTTNDMFGINGFNTQQVTDMSSMFEGCVMATAIDVSHFDTQNVTDMGSMFSGCIRLTTLNVSGLNTAQVTDMSNMFYDCGGFGGTLGALDVTSFDTHLVTDMSGMFYHVTASVDVTGFDTQNVTDMHEMFKNVSAETLDLRSFNTAKVTDMSGMFEKCLNLTTITVGNGWTAANVTSSANMFDLCGRLTGDKGTSYEETNPKDKTYAHIDGGTANPGYFTDVNGPYAALSLDGKTLTFYKDDQRLTRPEKTYSLNAGIFAVPGWTTDGSNATIESVVFDASFADARPVSTQSWCSGMTNLTSLTGMENLNTSEVTLMSSMFFNCTGLTSIDLCHFNTAKVTGMTSMFNGCTGLTTLDLSHFNTGNVTSMSYMFSGCTGLTTIFAGSDWSTAMVDEEFAEHLFDGCTSLVGGRGTTFDANHVDVAYAHIDGGTAEPGYFTDVNAPYAALSQDGKTLTFYMDGQRATRTEKTYNLNVGNDDPAWFVDGSKANVTAVVFHESFADARPTSTRAWFGQMTNLTSITGIAYLNTSEVTTMRSMFNRCSSLESLDLSHFNTSNVTSMRLMFISCSSLTSLDLSSFNTAKVTDMYYMFGGCDGLTNLDVSKFKTGNVTDMGYMFSYCSSLTSLNLSGFDTKNVTDMSFMFYIDSSLTSLNLSNFNTENVTSMGRMFYKCGSLTSLDLSSFNTAQVTDMDWMFGWCGNLTTIYVSDKWSTGAVVDANNMFTNSTNLVGGMGTTFDANHVDAAYAHIDGGTSNPGYFTEKPAALLGDVNLDDKVDVTDVNIVVNIILGKDQAANYDGRADVNNTGVVDVSDVNIVVNIILGKN